MKRRRIFLPLLVVCICFSGNTPAATDQYWNPGGTGGDGIWDTGPANKHWNLTAGAGVASNTFWQDSGD